MAIFKETSGYFGQGLGDMNNALGQYSIATGRRASPDQMYGMTQGMLSPLLKYDLARRQQQIENRMNMARLGMMWEQQHDAKPSALASGLKMAMGAAMAGSSAYNQIKEGQSYAKGGVINEPVVGQGLETGKTYTLGEEGPEQVTPLENNEEDDFWSIFKKKREQDEMNQLQQNQQPQQQPQQEQGGQSQMSPSTMLSIAKKTPLNKYLRLFTKASPQATTQESGYGAGSTPAYSSAYLAPEAGGMAAGEAGLATGVEGAGATAGGEAMAGMSGGTGSGAAGGGLGVGAGIGSIILAAIAAQHALSRNTGTRIDPSSGARLEKGSPGYYEGTKTSDVFGGHFGTEPWLAFAHDKFGLGPTAGEQFDAAKGSDKFAKAPAMLDYWANPLGTWTADIGEKALGEKGGKVARAVLNPLGELLKKIF